MAASQTSSGSVPERDGIDRRDLRSWLVGLPRTSAEHLIVGGTGHLILTPQEQDNAREHLQSRVLPALLRSTGVTRVSLVAGFAPGADLLFAQLVSRWLEQAGIACECVALLPVPVDLLIGDWLAKAEQEGTSISATDREDTRLLLDQSLAGCTTIIDLLPPGCQPQDLADFRFRQDQYRRLAACLSEQADVLIALLREQNLQRPGGTAEVVEWRRNPSRVPPAFSTLYLRSPPLRHRRLIIINPSVAPEASSGTGLRRDSRPAGTPAENRSSNVDAGLTTSLSPATQTPEERHAHLLRQCRQAIESGNYLQAYDLASTGLDQAAADSRSFHYFAILALANAGSTLLALKRFRAITAGSTHDDEDWLALEGRLLKDLALASPRRDPEEFLAAGEAYHAAFLRTRGTFPAINAATMLMLAGKHEQALMLASHVLDRVSRAEPGDETDAYFLRVTEAEAALLLGDLERCRAALRAAERRLRGNLNVRSRTATQLRLICKHFGIDEDLPATLTLAPVIYLPRPDAHDAGVVALGSTIDDASFVFAGLSVPAELVVIERFQQVNARLHLVLPASRAALLERWERQHGMNWATRLRQCFDLADEISVARGFLDEESDWCSEYVSAMALGLSRLAAHRLGCRWHTHGRQIAAGITIRDEQDDHAVKAGWVGRNGAQGMLPGTSAANHSGSPHQPIGRRCVGTLFADFAGYSRLEDSEMPRFQSLVLEAIGQLLSRWKSKILLQHTWGDAVHVVTADAESTADIAAEIHTFIESLRPTLDGKLAQLELRLAAHYAPVFEGTDPLEGTPTFYGSQVSFTARIEPITPPGMIFVTEAFAARLALDAPDRFLAEYAGELDLAKRFGKYRLFSLRRIAERVNRQP